MKSEDKVLTIILIGWFITLILISIFSPQKTCAADIGTSLSANYYLNGSPAKWYGLDKEKSVRFELSATSYISQDNWKFAIKPYFRGNGRPDLAGLFIGAAYEKDGNVLGVWHHSCHNLDSTLYSRTNDGNWFEAPICDYNSIVYVKKFGKTFETWW